MIAAQRQTGDDRFRICSWHDGVGWKGISHDSILALRVDRAPVQADAEATGSSRLRGFTKACNDFSLSRAGFVLEGYQKPAGMRRIIAVVFARPGVNVKHAARPNHHVAGVTNAIRKYRRAKTGG